MCAATPGDNYQRALARGAAYNTLGLVGKAILPLALAVATWLYGPDTMAGYLLALAVAEVAGGLVISGYFDATTLYASPHVEAGAGKNAIAERALGVVANGLRMSVGAALCLAVIAQLVAPPIIHDYLPNYAALSAGIPLLMWALVPRAIAEVCIAGTKACLHMEYEALLKGFVQPVTLLSALFATWFLGFHSHGIFIAHVTAECVLMVASVFALARHFPVDHVFRRVRKIEFDKVMMRFAIPQGISMTFHFYMSHIDVLMLTGLGASKLHIACYGTASRIIRELRQIRIIFSGALAPIFARQRAAGHIKDIEDTLGQLSRWTTTLCAHAILPLIVLRKDLLMAIDPDYGKHTDFVLFLLLVPYINCAFGLAGNALVFAGRSALSLVNNLGAALLGTILNWMLIPRLSLIGAALSAAAATLVVTALQITEIRTLDKIHWQWRAVALPHLGMIVCVGLLFALGDPANIGTLGTRVALALASVTLFSLIMLTLGHPEYRAMVRALIKRLR